MKAQITLTTSQSKRLIAKGITKLPVVQAALNSGKILLKGGTTVSAVAEELIGTPMCVSGRVTPLGTKTALARGSMAHYFLLQDGKATDVQDSLEETLAGIGKDDVVIIGANALDTRRNAALFASASLGGGGARVIMGALVEGAKVIIAVGLEKLIPGSIGEAVQAAGRKAVDFAMGASVGLMPICGHVVTEVDAVMILAAVKVTVIGRGGVMGAEGATTLVVEGEPDQVRSIFSLVQSIHSAPLSGDPETMADCHRGVSACSRHLGCIYLHKNLWLRD